MRQFEIPKSKAYFTPGEVAQILRVSPITVRGWASKGLLQAETTPGGHRRFLREDLERFASQWNPFSHRGALRVLIVDDDMSVVGFLRELLEGGVSPVDVEIALDGFEAGQKVQAFLPDVVLLDIMMPGIKGPEVCKRIKALPDLAQTRVIGMSGYLTPDAEHAMAAAGAERCLSKPLDHEALFACLDLENS